jgi:putative transcriptional regulator
MDSVKARLLVATPQIASGVFARSVVFMLEHDVTGALGVIVNRPLDAGVDEVLPDWASLVNAPICIFEGGPVQDDSALALGIVGADGPPRAWQPMTRRVGLVDLEGPLPRPADLSGLRVFVGYAGWSPGQLEQEMAEGAWIVADAREHDLVSARPELLWSEVLRRQDSDVRYLATFPRNPTAN